MKAISLLIAWGLVALLLPSALAHLDNPYYFLSKIHSYKLLPRSWGTALAATLPFLQFSIVWGLIWNIRLRQAAFLYAFFLFTCFTIVQSYTAYRGLNIACGCFGSAKENPIGRESIGLAAGAAVASLIGFLLTRKVQNRTQEASP